MQSLLLLAATLLSGCASKPKAYTPRYVYMVLYGGKFQGYPLAVPADPEKQITTSDIIGGMCLPIEDWKARETYIMELEDYNHR